MDISLKTKAFLVKLAYEPNPDLITDQLCTRFNITPLDIEYIYIKRTDTEAFMFRHLDTCFIFFAGTESAKDLVQDFVFIPSKYADGYIHSGFKKIIELTNKPIRDGIKRLFGSYHVSKILIGGHSLGAAIAMGAADALYYSGYDHVPTEVITFGCPNGWSRGARASFEKRHSDVTNYINSWDIVTWLLGLTTGRPGKNIKLPGKCGHGMAKYIENVENF